MVTVCPTIFSNFGYGWMALVGALHLDAVIFLHAS